ncbi:MAG: pyruvate kinase [Planctomycetota bacterium]|nr:pyruvate kinase [Planctomycetota bacterium]
MSSGNDYHENPLAKTKIIATVGPACESQDALRGLITRGVDIFRLNFAHGTHEWLAEIVAKGRDLSKELDRPIGLLGDLSGPKIRLGKLASDSVLCVDGAIFTFVRDRDPENDSELTCTYEPLVDDLAAGDRILLADGMVGMRVLETDPQAGWARCVVDAAGTIRSRQGVNLPGVALSTPSLTEKDRKDLQWAIENQLEFVGLSFVRSVDDVRLLRSCIEASGTTTPPMIVSKIEKGEAVAQLEQIIDASDAVMVARGDLGVEVDIVTVPGIQKRIIRLCNQKRVPVITATQMLDSMQTKELPTRAETSDVANAVLDGTDAVMLSGESAIGIYPREAVAMMSRIVREAETLLASQPIVREDRSATSAQAQIITEAVAVGAVATADRLRASLIAVATVSGRSALAISKERRQVPVLAVCESWHTARRMALLWGVTSVVRSLSEHTGDELAEFATTWGLREGVLRAGDAVVVVASSHWSDRGHDAMLVHVVE